MPIPLLVLIPAGIAVASGVVTIGQTFVTKSLQKSYKEAYSRAEASQNALQRKAKEFNEQAADYGRVKIAAAEDLQAAVEFLKKARMKHREFSVAATDLDWTAQVERLELQTEALKTALLTAGGGLTATGAAVAPAGIYAAVGLFGTASTGTAISSLSGAAFHSAKMAWIGRAVTLGSGGMAAGSTALTAVSIGFNLITLPLSLGAAFWSVKKGKEIKEKVTAELAKIAAAETDIARQNAAFDAVAYQIEIGKKTLQSAQNSLRQGLEQSDPDNPQDAHAVYSLADLLAHAIDAEIISEVQSKILGLQVKANA